MQHEIMDIKSEPEEKIVLPNESKIKKAIKTTKSEFNLNVIKMDVVLSPEELERYYDSKTQLIPQNSH